MNWMMADMVGKSSLQEAYDEGFAEGRRVALEEAAKVAEADNNHCGQRIADAIRALKDKS